MSLFEDNHYQWRETYFLFFPVEHHPTPNDVAEMFGPLKGRLQIREAVEDEDGKLEAMTIIAAADAAGIDVTLVEEEEVIEQREDLKLEMKAGTWSPEEKQKWDLALHAKRRFDLFHFQHVAAGTGEEDADLDPGAILSVLSALAKLCHGVAYDPQAGTFV